jgi:hypothetical protein
MRVIAGALAIGIIAAACASGGAGAPAASSTASANAPRRGNPALITQEEIEAVHLETIYDVIERLRPNMLRTHGPMSRISGATPADAGASASHINVYLNGTWIRDVSMLRSIQAASVKQVQYLNASDATTRFGTGHVGGAILITSK